MTSDPHIPYPPIADYAMISDCHCSALVSKAGSIDWCCMPRFDSDSCFGRLLDWEQGGYCSIAPSAGQASSTRRYLPGTMVLETHFRSADGEARLYDFFVMGDDPHGQKRHELVRLVEGISGSVGLRIEVVPRFDYGEIIPRVRELASGIYTVTGSNMGLVIQSGVAIEVIEHRELAADFRIAAGQRMRLALRFVPPELVDAVAQRLLRGEPAADAGFERTCNWWRAWSDGIQFPYEPDQHSLRSAIVLKSLSYERTGAIIAAPTASLPEWIGGQRNWDYRFSWVRDAVFTVRALDELGCEREADRFLQFIQRSAAGSALELQIMYGVDGKRRLTEIELGWLAGYRHSKPVRIGNLAAKQNQLDIYGEILEMAWAWHCKGRTIERQYWDFLADVVDAVCIRWRDSDYGIWEFRDGPRHHVHSKAMCWGAVDRGIRLAQEKQLPGALECWTETRDLIRQAIERDGYDEHRGVFVQAFGSGHLDAALLRLPRIGFVAYDDPRMIRTTDAICRALDRDGLLVRYSSPDGLPGGEGAFLPCTFWLVNCLAYQGRIAAAWEYYRRALGCANELGLFSEEFDMGSRQMLGNFPQALTHVSQIMARLALSQAAPHPSGAS